MHRSLRVTSFVSILITLATATAWAVDPAPGTYNSTDLGGSVLLGRASQSWEQPLNAQQGLNDVFNSQSWNGAALGTQWRFSCGVQPAVQTVQDNRNGSGTGSVVFTNSFSGGTFWLSMAGPWGDGVNDLTGTNNATQEIVTVVYVNNVPQQARINVDSSGEFDGSDCVLTFSIANGIGGGDTDLLPKPPGYPDFLDVACGATRSFGSWGDISQITMRIDCPVPSRGTTWGRVKTLYR
jgi:hypothetical protein